jgi:hypothetical protein
MTTTKQDFKSRLHAQVKESIERNLANHTIQQWHRDGEPGRVWKCSNNGSSVYSFTVCAPPGWLIMYGDMGECMWSRHRDMLAFVRGSIGSLHYFSEKASRDSVIEEERQELAEEWLDEAEQEWIERHGDPMNEEELEHLADIRNAYENYGDAAHLREAIYESPLYNGDTSSIPSCRYYTYHYLWKIEALKWFIAKLDAGGFEKVIFEW